MLPILDFEVFVYPQWDSLRMGPVSEFQICLCFMYPWHTKPESRFRPYLHDFICNYKFYGMEFSS